MIMKLLILLLLLSNSSWAAGNSVFLQQQNQTNSSTFIKQEGSNNKVGISADDPLIIDGNNITIIIKQIGNSTHLQNLTIIVVVSSMVLI